jgi:heterodisulfide reductase subunit A-like polyferredoxin
MYAIKEAVIAKEHSAEGLDAAIFYMDMRTYGKDFEKYYNRAREKGVRFVRSRVHNVEPAANGDGAFIRYITEAGEQIQEQFDIVVLSVGVEITPETVELARRLGIDVTDHNFARTSSIAPVDSSRQGIHVCGLFQGPKDIPVSVVEASAAACAAAIELAPARGTLVVTKEVPPERDILEETPRIGVFVCNCGINIAGVVNVPEVVKYSATLPHVVYTTDYLFTCSQDSLEKMKLVIEEQKLNRVVVASCTPRTHEPTFQGTLKDCGLNKYLFEMANIRDQDSWVHQKEPGPATEKAKDLVRMAVARASLLTPLFEKSLAVNPRALVVGGGISGMTAALGLARQGFETVIVEKDPQLGGMAKNIVHTIDGVNVAGYLNDLVAQVRQNDKIEVLTGSRLTGLSGYKGNFVSRIENGDGSQKEVSHGVIIVATGAHEYKPKEFLYGESKRIMTQIELGQLVKNNSADVSKWRRAVFIQCVGSRNGENPNCSRVCCQGAVKHALELKQLNPEMDVVVLYRDMRTYGVLEDFYTKARQQGVLFARFEEDSPPELVKDGDGPLGVSFKDVILQRTVQIDADAVILSAAVVAEENEELATLLKVPRNPEGFFIEAHVKLRPVDFASEGIYLCGTAHSPKLIPESIAQAMAATARAASFLSAKEVTVGGVVAQVDPSRCAACLVCVRNCPYGVPHINENDVSEINEALCQGCGICVSECPGKAISLGNYTDDQIMIKVDALLEGAI